MPHPTATNQKEKFQGSISRFTAIKADENGGLPKDIMLVKTGAWGNSVKGKLTIVSADLREMKENFDNGVGRFAGGTVGLPIDFGHAEWEKAAGWINEVEIRGSGESTELWSVNTEWTKSGAEAVLGGDYKGLSPSFYPSDRGGYVDPEDYDSEAKPNTLVGAALTNIPFFKGLTAVKADNFAQEDNDDNMLFISSSDNNSKKDNKMTKTIDEVRIMAAADLTDENKAVLKANESNLSTEEKTRFASVFASAPATNSPEQFSAEDRQVLADIKSGAKVVMSKVDHDALQSEVTASKEESKKAARAVIEADITEKAIKTGKIVADQLPKWADLVEADAKNMELLESLHDNEVVASENAKTELGGEGKDQVDADQALRDKSLELMQASAADGKNLTYADAKKQAQTALKEGK